MVEPLQMTRTQQQQYCWLCVFSGSGAAWRLGRREIRPIVSDSAGRRSRRLVAGETRVADRRRPALLLNFYGSVSCGRVAIGCSPARHGKAAPKVQLTTLLKPYATEKRRYANGHRRRERLFIGVVGVVTELHCPD